MSLSCDPNYTFSIDNHTMTVIEADTVNTQPLEVDSIQIFAAQRYSFVLEANQDVDNYWIRALPNAGTLGFADGINSAILRYDGAAAVEPAIEVVRLIRGVLGRYGDGGGVGELAEAAAWRVRLNERVDGTAVAPDGDPPRVLAGGRCARGRRGLCLDDGRDGAVVDYAGIETRTSVIKRRSLISLSSDMFKKKSGSKFSSGIFDINGCIFMIKIYLSPSIF